jgi:hypothetical protein
MPVIQAPTFTYLRRLGYAAVSGLAGWLVSQAMVFPVLLITAVRDSEGQAKLFVQTMLYGGVAWAGWSFLLASIAWLFVVVPLVMTIRPCLLVRRRYAILTLATGFALWLAARRPEQFRDPTGLGFLHRFANVIPYAVFAVSYTIVTACTYIVLSKQRLAAAEAAATASGELEREPASAAAPILQETNEK